MVDCEIKRIEGREQHQREQWLVKQHDEVSPCSAAGERIFGGRFA
jgi:hypothetical protein